MQSKMSELDINSGDWVVLPSAGGSFGHLAVHYAKYMSRRFIAIGGEEKRKLCQELGADHWIDSTMCKDRVGQIKKVTGGINAHAAIITTVSSSGYTRGYEAWKSDNCFTEVPKSKVCAMSRIKVRQGGRCL